MKYKDLNNLLSSEALRLKLEEMAKVGEITADEQIELLNKGNDYFTVNQGE